MPRYYLPAWQKVLGSEVSLYPLEFKEVAVDSRLDVSGCLFFALPGRRVNGHEFVREARDKGAVAAVVGKHCNIESGPSFPLIRVENPLAALQAMASSVVGSFQGEIIAITGSVGKTTVKEFLSKLLEMSYRTWATPRSCNSQIGLPLSILNDLAGNEEILILEMGMSAPGNIQRLVEIAPPTIAIITRIALVHAAFFADIESIAAAKGEIFSQPRTRAAFLPFDDPCLPLLMQRAPDNAYTFAANRQADYSLIAQGECSCFSAPQTASMLMPKLPIPGVHNYHNAAAACAIAHYLGVSISSMASALCKLCLPPKRLERLSRSGIIFIDDSYNAAEISVKAALDSMVTLDIPGRKIAVLGEMRELGSFSVAAHRAIGDYARGLVDRLYCIGEEAIPLWKAWGERNGTWTKDVESMIAYLKREIMPGDVVLLKGSNAWQLGRIAEEWPL